MNGHQFTASLRRSSLRSRLLLIAFLSLATWRTSPLSTARADQRLPDQRPPDQRPPDVVLILADDLAWSDLGCYDHPWHETPNLDRLAKSGMRFTNAYASAPICSASRASLLTGKTTARLGFEFVTKNAAGYQSIDQPTPLRAPPFQLNLQLNHRTIAEVLHPYGYQSTFAGKWHLNAHHGGYLGWSPTHGPASQGFDETINDFGSHPYAWNKNRPSAKRERGEFPTDSLIQQICQSIESVKDDSMQFHLASLYHVHTPIKTTCQWLIEKYESKIPKHSPARERRIRYAAFVETLDHHVGQILQAVDRVSANKETLVIFTSDNGGHPEYTANGPLRGSKWNLYEGGIRVPLIARWPGTTPKQSVCDQPVVGYDILPTLLELCNQDSSEPNFDATIDGQSFATALLGVEARKENREHEREIIWHFPYYHPETGYAAAIEEIGVNDFKVSKTHPHSAIRIGRNKLLLFPETDHVELYDLEADISESNDLSEHQPEVADRLAKRLKEYLSEVDARLATPPRS
ncbi:MAG: sulfatase [Rubripirellula sp.]|nr:sulfatase [Rubripirellula sp.]